MRRFLVVIAVLAAVAVFLGYFCPDLVPFSGFGLRRTEAVRQTMRFLNSEHMQFLVTRQLSTKVVLEREQGNAIVGKNMRLLVATVKIYWGMDLSKVKEMDITAGINGITVVLPEPEVLEQMVDFSSARAWRLRSGLNWLIEEVAGNVDQDLLESLRMAGDNAIQFFREQGLLPDRATLIGDLNGWADELSGRIGTRIEFR